MRERLSVPQILICWAVMIGVLGGLYWLLASEPRQPAEGAFSDHCKAIAQTQEGATEDQRPAPGPASPFVENGKTAPQNPVGSKQDEKPENDRRVADYTCELAVYTAQLATFTKWLVIATLGLGAIGVGQGVVLHRSVNVADRAAVEAKDAIEAAKTSAQASLRSADIAERSLVLAGRPWVDAKIRITGQLAIEKDKKIGLPVHILITNHGQSPALQVTHVMDLFDNLDAALNQHTSWCNVSAKMMLGVSVRLSAAGMLAQGGELSEVSIVLTPEAGNASKPTGSADEDMSGIFLVFCVSYGLPASKRARYTTGIYEIIWDDGSSIDVRVDSLPIPSHQLAIRYLGIGEAT